MCQNHQHRLTRRGFLVLSGAALGSATLACRGGPRLLELTAVPNPGRVTPSPPPTFTPSAVADTSAVADAILVNGNVVTMDAKRAAVQAVAIKDGRILLVGDDQTVRNMAGDSSQVIDLSGRTVTPGLIDAHCHLSACLLYTS